MELAFQENRTQCMEQLFHDTVIQEETAEIIVPEGWPDIFRVVDSFAAVQLRQKEVGTGIVTVSGGVRGGILYVPEGEQKPKLLQTYLPFTVKKEIERLEVNDKVQIQLQVCQVDARMISSRKAMLRLSLASSIAAYSPQQIVTYTLPEPEQDIMTYSSVLPMKLCLDAEEKSFAVNEEVLLPEELPAVEEILKEQYRLNVTEKKMVGNKLAYKGTIGVHTLYSAQDGSLNSCDSELPFSQYVELSEDRDGCEPEIVLSVTGAELTTDGQLDCHRLLLNMNLLAQCTVFGVCSVPFVSDAYSTVETLMPEYHSISLTGLLDHREYRDTMVSKLTVPIKKTVDVYAYPEQVRQNRNGDTLCLQYALNVNLLYYDQDNQLQGRTVHIEHSSDMSLSPNGQCRAGILLTEPCAVMNGGQTELRCPIVSVADSYAAQEIRGICGGKTEPIEEEAERPSLILRRIGQEESLWSIAKSYRTTVQKIMEANGLQEEAAMSETLLLIPM
ncbi:MAG: DUF3794 domain-containing protein [Clostridia bacterium]|nr:DUF3794 domain-containing protein [Clostridia bacterium]